MIHPLVSNFLQDWGISVGAKLNDFMMLTLPRPAPSGKVAVVGSAIPENFAAIQKNLQVLLDQKPLFVISTLPLPLKNASSAEVQEFVKFASGHSNLYFYSNYPDKDPLSLAQHPDFKKTQHVFIPLTQDRGSDGMTRRLIIDYDVNDPSIDHPLMGILGKYGISSKVEDFPTYPWEISLQTHLRYRHPAVAPIILLNQLPKSVEGQILILGLDDVMNDDGWGSAISGDYMTLSQRVALDLETLIQKDAVDRFMRTSRQIFAFIFVFAYLCGVLFLSPVAATLWGGAVILSYFVIAFASLYFFNKLLFLLEVPFVLMLAHFFIAPLLLIRHLRLRDRQVADLEMQRLRSNLVIKTARAEQGLKIATQVAHDMRSPLTALTIANEYKGHINPEAADLIDKSIVRLHRISDDLLKKFRSGGLYEGAAAQVLNLSEVLAELKDAYEKSWTRLKIHLQCPPDVLVKTSDPTAIERAISNMLNNSLEAAAKNVPVEVRLNVKKAKDGMIEIELSDNGPGVPAEIRARIFERGETHNKADGSGLGLWQVRETFRGLNGDAVLQDKTPGAHFLLTFSSGLVPQVLHLHRNVILLEDNNTVRERWVKRLQDLGAHVVGYSSPDEFEKYKGEVSGTVITDLIFENSDKTGFQVLESLQGKSVQKVLCTSLGNNAEIHDMAGRLADIIFTKAQFEELLFTDTTRVEFTV